MLLSEGVDRYLADRKAKGTAAQTVRSHKTYLKMLLADIGNIQMSSIQPRHMDTFWARHDEWSAGNFNKVRAIFTTFFTWTQARGYMPKSADPMVGLRKRKVVPLDRIIVPPSDFDKVMATAQNPRDRMLLALGFYLFTRISESTGLRWQDLNWDKKEVSVFRTKTQTIDVLPMCAELEHELKRWQLEYGGMLGEVVKPGWFIVPSYSKPVFLGSRGGKNKQAPIFQEEPILQPTRQLKDGTARVKLALRNAGYEDLAGEGGHTLRRSGATALYHELAERGHDRAIRMCQAMLGHKHIQTTEIYLRLDLDRKARNDLLAGKPMFQSLQGGAQVIHLAEGGAATGG